MALLELLVRPRIDPQDGIAPLLDLCETHFIRQQWRALPGNLMTIVKGLTDPRNKSESKNEECLLEDAALHA